MSSYQYELYIYIKQHYYIVWYYVYNVYLDIIFQNNLVNINNFNRKLR